MKRNSRLEARRKKISQDTKYFVDHSFAIVDRIYEMLEAKGMEQKDLANALGKKESEISKWLTGTHNFTLKTIAKIESLLGEPIIEAVKPIHQKEMNYLIIKSDKYKMEQPGHSIDILCEPHDTYLYSNTEGNS